MPWSYRQAEEHVLALEQFGMRFGLERIKALLAELGSPQNAYESVHVVGSNGKSSTVRMIAALLDRHGANAGSYLSPHLHGYYERVRFGDVDVDRDAFAAAIEQVAAAATTIEKGRAADDLVTQFEMLTAAAFLLLAEAGVEVAVIEAGLGGRHDATNVLERSRVQVLTNVALEHTRWLGSTISEIAGEKLAVVKAGASLAIGAGLHADAMAVAHDVCAQRGATIVVAAADPGVPVIAAGDYQRRNFALARAAVEVQLGEIDPAALTAVGASVIVPGRFEVRESDDGGATVVLDGAHNPHGAAELAASLRHRYPSGHLVGLVSILDDKDAEAMLRAILDGFDAVVCTKCSNPRSLEPQALQGMARRMGVDALVVREPHAALTTARELAGAGGVAVATGSLYLLADLDREPGTGKVSAL